jgi:hypothetical protein
MAHSCEARERAVEELARGAPMLVRDEADAARIALASGIVEEVLRVAQLARLSSGRNEDSPAGASVS